MYEGREVMQGEEWILSDDLESVAVDYVMSQNSPLEELSLDEQLSISRELCAEMFTQLLDSCPEYARFVERMTPYFQTDHAEPDTYPPIPTGVFKRKLITSGAEDEIDKICTSSGTQGSVSEIPRTRTSVERLLGSVRVGLKLVADWYEDNLQVIHLGPGYEDADEVWFSFVMSLAEMLFPTLNFMREGVLDLDSAIACAVQQTERGKEILVIGAPFTVLEFARLADSRGKKFENVHVITGGGWKRVKTDLDTTGFRAEVSRLLNMPETRIRDVFNQVELNSAFFECQEFEKHVPPWVWPVVRDPLTLLPLPDGEVGLLSYADASADGYPGIIIGDDLGVVTRGRCKCGLEGVRMSVIRRLEKEGNKGCAYTLDEQSS